MQWLILFSSMLLAAVLAVAVYTYQNGAVAMPIALKPAQPTILLVGPSNSGKTSLFQKIVHDKRNTLTYTSQKPNIGQYSLQNGRKVKVVDVPGHPKLFSTYKSISATSITFVLDSSTIAKNADTVSRSLVDILSYARKMKVAEVSILANKSDFFTALSTEKITELINTEVEQIRQQKNGLQMDQLEEQSEEDDDWLQDLSGPFRLADECVIFSGSVLKDDITAWEEWIESASS